MKFNKQIIYTLELDQTDSDNNKETHSYEFQNLKVIITCAMSQKQEFEKFWEEAKAFLTDCETTKDWLGDNFGLLTLEDRLQNYQ